ncbi:3-oxoacyl-[acyl-carrier-protein] reductase FabG [Purpureocillium lavendulum]|uniref:3-oxoacyl-[acyl-carrier-protein] reductase FabG n=1 Tax=Purpureocillium lavendulum TaxID=1247861 RepID=A0AB34FR90_9HYPO|nr:3-oxoacyl-[acyl-carrier-protein] reductase FabG [Purpureocillium lavendulum]
MASFDGKVIAITGAASGMGLATVELLASRGAVISLADINEEAVKKACNSLPDSAKHTYTVVDVRKAESVNQWIKTTKEKFGRLDGAVNMAGIITPAAPVIEHTDEDWDVTFAVNTKGAAGIALLDINEDALSAVKGEILDQFSRQPGTKDGQECRIDLYPIDVTNDEEVTQTVNAAAATFGRLDYVVNAAGIAIKHEGGAAFAKTADWQRVLDINLTGTFFVLRAAAQIMLKQEPIQSNIDGRPLQRGSIINFGSIQGVVGITLSTAYTATKHAVIGLTRTASEDYAKDGLRINAICPGYTETPMTTKNPQVLKAMMERVSTAVPMQRMGNPQEIADGVLYLAGGRSSFVTGSVGCLYRILNCCMLVYDIACRVVGSSNGNLKLRLEWLSPYRGNGYLGIIE